MFTISIFCIVEGCVIYTVSSPPPPSPPFVKGIGLPKIGHKRMDTKNSLMPKKGNGK